MVITAASPAELIALTAAPGPPQTCPHHCGEGEQRQKKGSAFLHRVCAFLSSCMEIIPIGGNCFPDKREGAGGGTVGEGFWGLSRVGSSSWGAGGERSGPYFSSQSTHKGHIVLLE